MRVTPGYGPQGKCGGRPTSTAFVCRDSEQVAIQAETGHGMRLFQEGTILQVEFTNAMKCHAQSLEEGTIEVRDSVADNVECAVHIGRKHRGRVVVLFRRFPLEVAKVYS